MFLPSICLSVCCWPKFHEVKISNHLLLDSDLGIVEGFFITVRWGIFGNLAHITEITDRIFLKIFRQGITH